MSKRNFDSVFWFLCPLIFFTSCSVTNLNTVTKTPKDQYTPPLDAEVAVINTRFGQIVLDLYDKEVPSITRHFRQLIKLGTLNGTPLYRVIPGYLIQGGESASSEKPSSGGDTSSSTISSESGPFPRRGSIAMVHGNDQLPTPKVSSGFHFCILLRDVPELASKVTVFGRVLLGMDVVEEISQVPTDDNHTPLELTAITVCMMPFEMARGLSTEL